jgi:hypothetical protein
MCVQSGTTLKPMAGYFGISFPPNDCAKWFFNGEDIRGFVMGMASQSLVGIRFFT